MQHGRCVRHHNPVARPSQDLLKRRTRGGPIKEGSAELARYLRLSFGHEIEPRHERPPPGQRSARQLLKDIGEQHSAACDVKEHNLGGDQIPADHDLLKIGRPWRSATIIQIAIKGDIAALPAQTRRRVGHCHRIGRLPLAQKQMVQAVGRDEVVNLSERINVSAQGGRQRHWRPDQKATAGQANNGGPRWVTEASHVHVDAIGKPYAVAELL